MIRNYESLGLITEPERTDAGYRLYGERELSMLRFIRQSRSLGFSMQQIEALMSLWRDPERRSHDVKEVARRQLAELQERQRELDQMRATLEQMVAACRGDHGAHCFILEQLAVGPDQGNSAATRARRTLKQVRPGEKRATLRPRQATTATAHGALAAWTHTFARPATA
jgi:Cu(I)-responsive transcriptional regulator